MRGILLVLACGAVGAGCMDAAADSDDACVTCECECPDPPAPLEVAVHVEEHSCETYVEFDPPFTAELPANLITAEVWWCETWGDGSQWCEQVDTKTVDGVLRGVCRGVEPGDLLRFRWVEFTEGE